MGLWALAPATGATLDPATAGSVATDTVKVTGEKKGLVTLRATVEGESADAYLAVLPKVAVRKASVSALGAGIGGFVIAMTALGFAATLGAVNNLGSEIATIIGAPLGAGAATGVAASKGDGDGNDGEAAE